MELSKEKSAETASKQSAEKVGFFLIDKVRGINSFKLVMALRKVLGLKRVGFAGTLDPLASGLMILAVGEYTKLLPYLEIADKVYDVTVQMDGVSDTYDMEGQISKLPEGSYAEPARAELNKIIEQQFVGKIEQVPPKFSAIQIDGKRAYDMARKGQEFEMKARPVEVFSIEVLEYQFPELKLRVHCSSGTYIRSLAFDIGKSLGVGGYVTELRRTKIAGIKVEDARIVEEITAENWQKLVVPAESLLSGMQQLVLEKNEYEIMARGNFVVTDLYSQKGLDWTKPLLGIYEGKVVGVLETLEAGRDLKFKKKLNLG